MTAPPSSGQVLLTFGGAGRGWLGASRNAEEGLPNAERVRKVPNLVADLLGKEVQLSVVLSRRSSTCHSLRSSTSTGGGGGLKILTLKDPGVL